MSTQPGFRRTTRFAGLALVLSLALATMASLAPQVFGGNRDGRWSNGDRGDNPVIGSLPCAAAPQMEWMFWEGLENEDLETSSFGFAPMMAMTGENLDSDILTANGDPYGRVNRYENWDAVGSTNYARFILDRYAVQDEEILVWHWVPNEYRGGLIEVFSPFGNTTFESTADAFQVPVSLISGRSGTTKTATAFTFWPNGANADIGRIKLQVEMINEVVVLTYLP